MRRASLMVLWLCLWCSAAWAEGVPAQGATWTEPESGIVFVWVPSGSYMMGCAGEHCPESEVPPQQQNISGFWLSRTEITQDQWKRLMPVNPSKFRTSGAYPVDQVTWEDAHAVINRLNQTRHGTFRLPTEAEWEYACRASVSGDTFCGGNDPKTVAWYNGNTRQTTMPTGQKTANGWGLYDMSGNLWEWTSDCWRPTYADPPICDSHALRGGSWGSYPAQLHATSRRSDYDVKCPFIGLRLVRNREK